MNLEEFEAICDQATPGPWQAVDGGIRAPVGSVNGHSVMIIVDPILLATHNNLRFIAAVREMVPKLIKVAKTAKECDDYLFDKNHFPLNQIGCRSQLHLQLSVALGELEQP